MSQIKEKSVNAVRKRETIFDIEKRERERCVIGIHNWNDVGAILIQKVSSKKQEASIEGSSVYKAEEDGGSVFWKRGNASIAGLSRRPTRVRQALSVCRTRREKEREISYANARFAPDASSGHASLILNHR